MSVENTAIQSDVEDKQEEKKLVVGNVDRNNFVSQIAKSAQKERDEELEKNGEQVVNTSGEQQEIVEEVPEITVDEPAIEEKEEQKPKTVKIKVDGQEVEVLEDKILDAGIRTLQKESAADRRLEEATRLLKEAKEYVKPKEAEILPQEWDDQTVAYALQHGDEEQKAYAVSLLRGRENTIQPDHIAQQVTQKVLDTVDFNNASAWFQNEYKDIVGDPYLFQLAAMSEDKARANGDQRPRSVLYKEIGDSLRKWKGGTQPTTASLETKQEKKSAGVTNIPSASMKKETKQEAPKETAQDVIAKMRKARGQYT